MGLRCGHFQPWRTRKEYKHKTLKYFVLLRRHKRFFITKQMYCLNLHTKRTYYLHSCTIIIRSSLAFQNSNHCTACIAIATTWNWQCKILATAIRSQLRKVDDELTARTTRAAPAAPAAVDDPHLHAELIDLSLSFFGVEHFRYGLLACKMLLEPYLATVSNDKITM